MISRRWWVVALLAGLVTAPLQLAVAGEPADHSATMADIQKLPKSEQDRLRRNFEEWKRLSPEKREYYREFHRELERDTKQQGSLRTVMNAYYEWVQTLSGNDRDELIDQTDMDKRLALAQSLHDRESRSWRDDRRMRWGRSGGRRPSFWDGKRLSSEDLSNILEVAEQHPSVSADFRTKLDSLNGIEHHLALLEHLFAQPAVSGSDRAPRSLVWADGKMVKRMIEAISDSAIREDLKEMKDPRWPLNGYLFSAWIREGEAELNRRLPKLSDTEQSQIVAKLEDSRREELLKEPLRDQSRHFIAIESFDDDARKKVEFEFLNRFRDVTGVFFGREWDRPRRSDDPRGGRPDRPGDRQDNRFPRSFEGRGPRNRPE